MSQEVRPNGSGPGQPPESQPPGDTPPKHLNVRQAAFIGVGAMVGAGNYALLGAAGAVAGAAVWLSFLIFPVIPAAHFRVRSETHAKAAILAVAIAAAGVVLVTFIFTTLIHEPASMITLLAVILLGVGLDFGWKRTRAGRAKHEQVALGLEEQG